MEENKGFAEMDDIKVGDRINIWNAIKESSVKIFHS
jgi:hypothetical protein